MKAFKQLLAATDFSEHSLHAVDRGFLIAKTSGARYTIMHVLESDKLAELREWLGEEAAPVSESILQDARDSLAGIFAYPVRNHGASAILQLEQGLAGSAIPRHAEAIGADLILLGAHGKGFLRQFLLGSTTSHLMRKSKVPVLAVKNEADAPYRRVLIATDFSKGSALAIDAARRIAPDAEILLVHIFDVPFEGKLRHAGVDEGKIGAYRINARERALQQLRNQAAAAGLSVSDYRATVLHGNPAEQILLQEEASGCDLIVLGKHGTHITEELLMGSVTKRVLAESRCDILVVVNKADNTVDMA